MTNQARTSARLETENEQLRQRVRELEARLEGRDPACPEPTAAAMQCDGRKALALETELRRVMASISHYLWSATVDPSGAVQYRYYSPVVERITGYPPEFFLSGPQQWLSTVHPDDRQRVSSIATRLTAGQTTCAEEEYRIVRPDGTIRWVRDSVVAHPLADGCMQLDGVVSDVTERRQAEDEALRSKAILRAAIDSLPLNFFAMGPDGRYMLQNAASRMLRHGTIIGKLPEEVSTCPEDLAVWLENNRRAFAGERVEGEVTLNLTGEKRDYYNVLAPIRDGNQLYGILGFNIDITDHKRAEEALRKARDELERRVEERTAELRASNEHLQREIEERTRAEEGLRHSHDELRTIYEGTVDGLLIADCETGRFVRANPALCEMLGYSEGQLLALSVHDIHPPEVVPDVLERFRSSTYEQRRISLDRPVLRGDRTVIYADIAHTRITYRGRPCVIGFFRDISERKQAREALDRERQTLRHMLQASDHERQVIAYEIHDGLTQQIAAAIMQLQAHEHLRDQPEKARMALGAALEMLQLAHAEARRLISGVRPPVLDEAGLETAIAHLVHDERAFKGPKIEYKSEVQFDRLPRILENTLYRIAQEALTNACRHSESQMVRVHLRQEDQVIRLEVQDWGVGFDPQIVGDGHYGLEGIRERVRLLDGKLTLHTAPGQGTLLRVDVPLAE